MQGIADEVAALVRSLVAGDLFAGADDDHLIHEAFYDDVAKAVRRGNRVVARAVANERRRRHARSPLFARLENARRQRAEGGQVRLKPGADRLRARAGAAIEFRKAIRFKLRVQRLEACGDGDRRQEPAPAIFNKALDLALVIALAGPPEAVAKQIMARTAR